MTGQEGEGEVKEKGKEKQQGKLINKIRTNLSTAEENKEMISEG